ncbi:MAG TPA: RodZ domain-containing protein [Usitatibacter sp.]|nr:RodZ domain-containing protein [Usitatibacter sp.]
MDPEAGNAEAATRRTLGQTLATERERQGLSRGDAAQRLHMSAYQIEALETGDFTRLPKGTFLRGFVRNYAKVLGLAPDSVLSLLVEDAPPGGRPGIVVPTQNIRFDPLHERLQSPYVKAATIAFVVVAVALAAMYWWLFIRPALPSGVTRKPAPATPSLVAIPIPETAPFVPPTATVPPQPLATGVAATPVKPAAAPAKPPAAEKSAAAENAPAVDNSTPLVVGEGPARLRFRFHGDSWVEVRDARGRVIVSKLNPAGSEAQVAGQPPFRVIVGNAPDVELFYNDREFDLGAHTNVAVARFTVE